MGFGEERNTAMPALSANLAIVGGKVGLTALVHGKPHSVEN